MTAVQLTPDGPVLVDAHEAPAPLGRDEVAVRVRWVLLDEADRALAPVPRTAGAGCVGVVTSVGDHVDTGLVGADVLLTGPAPCRTCATCRRGQGHVCLRPRRDGRSTRGIGGARDALVVPRDRLTPVPEGMAPAAAAVLGGSGLTGAAAVRGAARLVPGERIALVGDVAVLTGVAVAVHAGARAVVAAPLVTTDEELARALGADVVGPPTALAELVAEVGGDRGGVDGTVVLGGTGPVVAQAVEVTRPGGTVVVVDPVDGTPSVTLGQGRTLVHAPFGGADADRDLSWLVPLVVERGLDLDGVAAVGARGLTAVVTALDAADGPVRSLHEVG